VLHGDWWYTRAPQRELAERLPTPPGTGALANAAGAPPLPQLREAASPLLRKAAVETARHVESAELESALTALGYVGGGGGSP
jgi:hypothetical protein